MIRPGSKFLIPTTQRWVSRPTTTNGSFIPRLWTDRPAINIPIRSARGRKPRQRRRKVSASSMRGEVQSPPERVPQSIDWQRISGTLGLESLWRLIS